MPTVFDIANAIAAELNTEYAGEFTAVVTAAPLADLKTLRDLRVSVVPKAVQPVQSTRTSVSHDMSVDIGIQKKAGDDLEADCVTMAALAQEILDFLWDRRLATAPAARFITAANEPIFAPEHLQQFRVFTSVITVTYRV